MLRDRLSSLRRPGTALLTHDVSTIIKEIVLLRSTIVPAFRHTRAADGSRGIQGRKGLQSEGPGALRLCRAP